MFGWILRKIRSFYNYFAYRRQARHIANEIFKEDLVVYFDDDKMSAGIIPIDGNSRIPFKNIDNRNDIMFRKKRPNIEDIEWTPLEEYQNKTYSSELRLSKTGRMIAMTFGDTMNHDAYGDDKPKPKAKKKTTKKPKKKGKK